MKIRLLFLGAVVATACGTAGDSPGDSLISYFEALEAGEISEAANMVVVSSESAAAMRTSGINLETGLSEMSSELDAEGGVEDIQILNEEVHGNTGTVQFRVLTGDGEEIEGAMTLLLRDGEWKVSM